MVKESQWSRKVLRSMNSTFLLLIPKKQECQSFKYYRPISCCDMIYKVITNILAIKIKPMLSEIIGEEQSGFLINCQIHDVVILAQEVLHSAERSKEKISLFKLDLSKEYDRVDWTFLRLVLVQMRMSIPVVNWIMSCVNSASFVIFINGSPSRFFSASRGPRHGCPLSTFIFLIIVDSLSRLIKEAISLHRISGFQILERESISHIIFIDNIFCCLQGSTEALQIFKEILYSFNGAIGREINFDKSSTIYHN